MSECREAHAKAANPKYFLDPKDTTRIDGVKLYRIVALREFWTSDGLVEVGERGGWVQGEHNLSHAGACWIAGQAIAMRQARVEKNGFMCDRTKITDDVLITDDAQMRGDSQGAGSPKMLDETTLDHKARILGSAEMRDRSHGGGEVIISGRSVLAGDFFAGGTAVISGTQYFDTGEVEDGVWMGGGIRAAKTPLSWETDRDALTRG
jgi:hypothetical protein